MGGLGRLHSPPRPPALRGGPEKEAVRPGRTSPDGLADEPDDHGLGRSRGGLSTKLHLAADAAGHVLAVVITGGQRGDAPHFIRVMDRIKVPRTGSGRPRVRPDHVLTDRAYSSREIRAYLRRRQIPHTIPEKRDQAGHACVEERQVDGRPASTANSTRPDTRSSAGSPVTPRARRHQGTEHCQ
ncbi:transposase [Streptomyces sp. NPDC005863]|uniref:transposase n=1 Tax=Streptomyces sp. NPDC005863 TaxID=3364735 RepID=UPI00367D75DA